MSAALDLQSLTRAPAALLSYQAHVAADKSQVRVVEKSRRIGLTWGTASEASLTSAASREAGGMDSFYIGYNKEMALEFVRDAANWARFFQLAASEISEEVFKDEDKDILTYVIRFASGFRIVALSSRPSNLRGRQGLVIIDEAGFHDDLAELLKAALALLIWGGKLIVISTHNGVDNAFNELVQSCREARRPYSLHRITFDDALAAGLYKRICLVRGEEWTPEREAEWAKEIREFYGEDAEEELDCVPKSSGGAFLSRALIEARMVKVPILRLDCEEAFAHLDDHERHREIAEWCEAMLAPLLSALPSDCLHVFGEDFGRTSDLTVIAPGTLTSSLMCHSPFLVELRLVPFRQQEQILFYIVDRLPRLLAGALDATGNGQYLAEVAAQRYGATRIEQVKLSDAWYGVNLPKFKARLDDGLSDVPRDSLVLEDLRALQVIGGVPKLPKAKTSKGKGAKPRHGDAAIALALRDYACLMDVEIIEYTPVRAAGVSDRFVHRQELRPVRTDKMGFRNIRGGL